MVSTPVAGGECRYTLGVVFCDPTVGRELQCRVHAGHGGCRCHPLPCSSSLQLCLRPPLQEIQASLGPCIFCCSVCALVLCTSDRGVQDVEQGAEPLRANGPVRRKHCPLCALHPREGVPDGRQLPQAATPPTEDVQVLAPGRQCFELHRSASPCLALHVMWLE